MTIPEEDLVARAQDGDLSAFESLVREHQEMAYAIAYRIAGNADDAKDICQESFIKLHRRIGQYRPRHPFPTWLYRLVVNTAIDFQRRERRFQHVSLEQEKGLPGKNPWSDQDFRLSLDRILGDLSPKQRSAFMLRDLQGFPLEEVAQILGCNPITARVHLHHARRNIRKRLEEEG